MEIIRGLKKLIKKHQQALVVLGFFDGLHQGHQALIRQAKSLAASFSSATAVLVYTFDRHPLEIVNPSQAPRLLSTLEEKIKLASGFYIDYFLVGTFDEALSQLEPEVFLADIVKKKLNPKMVAVGFNYRYGKGHEGNVDTLLRDSARLGFPVTVAAPVEVNGTVVSSTKIRALLLDGKIEQTNSLLGRNYSIQGKVIRGSGRGKNLGIPTANLELPPRKLVPRPGIYAALVHLDKKVYPGIASIGNCPTFDGKDLVTEVHLFDFNQNLYNQTLVMELIAWRRPQEKFPSAEALISTMKQDLAWGRNLLGKSPASPS